MGTSNLMGKRIKNVKESAISDHLLQAMWVPITFDDFDILTSDSNKFKSLIKENLLTKKFSDIVLLERVNTWKLRI